MLKFLKLLCNHFTKKQSHDNSVKNDITKSKKCINCLRRINLDLIRCPYCKSSNFLYSDL
jgi:hypothetical protein